MDQLLGSPILGAIAAMGYAMGKILLVGLASTTNAWIFSILASASLVYSAVKPISDSEAPYAFVRHIAAVMVAALLLYGYKNVDLSSIVGDKLALGGATTVTQGAAPLPTYLVDTVGSAITSATKQIVAQPNEYLIPMLSNVVREATANPANLVDKQVAANLESWRFITAAAMRADSGLAQAIQSKGLLNRLQNPVALSDLYSGKAAAAEMAKVVSILDDASPAAALGGLVCNNATHLKTIADDFSATAWVPDDCTTLGGVSLSVVSGATKDAILQAQAPASYTDPNTVTKAAKGAAAMGKLISDNAAAIAPTHFATLSELYRSLGSGALVSAAVQSAQDDSFKVLLGEQCLQKGDNKCLGSFAPVYNSLANVVEDTDHGNKPSFSFSWSNLANAIWKMIAGVIAYIVGGLMMMFSKLVAALMPFAISMARAIAIIVSIVGVFLLLLPGRVGESIKWMIGPIAWTNLWGIFYLIWWKLSELFIDFGEQLFWDASTFSGDGISGVAVVQFTVAAGYTALPVIAWHIVFGGPERLFPRGGVGAMIRPATQFATQTATRYLAGRWIYGRQSGKGPDNASPPGAPPGAQPSPGQAPVPSNPANSHGSGGNSTHGNSSPGTGSPPSSNPAR